MVTFRVIIEISHLQTGSRSSIAIRKCKILRCAIVSEGFSIAPLCAREERRELLQTTEIPTAILVSSVLKNPLTTLFHHDDDTALSDECYPGLFAAPSEKRDYRPSFILMHMPNMSPNLSLAI